MIDMSTWENIQADVVETTPLHLDPHNVRLETPRGVPESDIIQDLFTNEKALSLVEAISQVGYFTHELPIVVMRNNQMIVVEGNRRLAALKEFRILISPRITVPGSLDSPRRFLEGTHVKGSSSR